MQRNAGPVRADAEPVADARAVAVRGDQVIGVDAVFDAAAEIAHDGQHTVGAAVEGDQLGAEPHVGAAGFGAGADDPLQLVLVDHRPVRGAEARRRPNLG
jgi:hypothetical protein